MFKKTKTTEGLIAWRKAKQEHRVAIRKLKRDIKRHKMLLKQARLAYKITKA